MTVLFASGSAGTRDSPLTFRAACIILAMVKNGEEDFPTRRITNASRCNHRHAWRIILPWTLLMGLAMRGGPGSVAAQIDGMVGALSHAGRGLAS